MADTTGLWRRAFQRLPLVREALRVDRDKGAPRVAVVTLTKQSAQPRRD